MDRYYFERLDEHYLALGRFINQFSIAEDAVHHFLVWKSGVAPEFGPAIFSGTRMDAAMSLVRRLYETRGVPLEPDLEKAFSHLSLISNIRNDLLHYGTRDVWGAEPYVTTERAAHIPERVRKIAVPLDVLGQLALDVSTIAVLLMLYVEQDANRPIFEEHVRSVLADDAWFYKPPPQAPNRPTTRDAHAKPQRPQKPSRA